MIIAPLIHTRTFRNDFDSRIKVIPNSFLDSDINWVRKTILEATKSIDSLQGERWVIIDNSKFRIAGVVGFLKDICLKCHTNEESKEYEELFFDDKGRLVYAFIGIVINKSQTNNYCPVTRKYLWETFVKLIHPVWKRTYQEQIRVDFTDYNASENLNNNISDVNILDAKEFYESNPSLDYNLFLKYLCNKNKSNFSLCTNVNDYNVVKACSFSILTTTLNNITRMKRIFPDSLPSDKIDENLKSSQYNNINNNINDTSSKKNFLFLLVTICLPILINVILIVLFWVKIKSYQLR